MTQHISGYSVSRSSRSIDRFMIIVCAVMVFALCTNYTAAAQHPNLLEQIEGDLTELSHKAVSWSMNPISDTDTLAQETYDIGLGSDSADWDLITEEGTIDFVYDTDMPFYTVLPDPAVPIPLCITNSWLSNYQVVLEVYGNYAPEHLCLYLEQKGEDESTPNYYCIDMYLYYSWEDSSCCSRDYYVYRFRLPDCDGDGVPDKICLDANNFPTVGPDFTLNHLAGVDDLGKEVTAHFCSLWSGCWMEEQQFTITIVHSNMGVLSYVSPFPLF